LFNQRIWDARPGIGTDKSASPALTDGPSTQRVSVFQFLTTATNSMLQEPVFHASRDTKSSMENVFCQLQFNQRIWDARPGIGTDKFAWPALTDGPSTQRVSAFQFLTTATNSMLQEPVFHASRDTKSSRDNAFCQPSLNQRIWDARLGIGTDKSASPALKDGPSTQRVSAFQFLTTATNLMLQELVLHASRDTKSSMENVFCQLQFNQRIWDARPGIGTDKSASPALTDGPSTQRVSAFQFLTTATNSMLQEPAFHASRVMKSLRENVFCQPSLSQRIWDARPGIGTDKFASPALTDGPSTQRVSAFQFLTTATNLMLQEPAFHASRDTKSSRENVSCQPLLNQRIWDARLGIGTDKFASPALTDGPSTQRVSVFQFLTTATNSMLQEPAFHASRDTKSSMENVFCQLQFNQRIWDARPGIGTDKSALPALTDGPSTQRVSVFQFLTTATHGMLQVPVFHAIRDMN
jgi:hypothetical protein